MTFISRRLSQVSLFSIFFLLSLSCFSVFADTTLSGVTLPRSYVLFVDKEKSLYNYNEAQYVVVDIHEDLSMDARIDGTEKITIHFPKVEMKINSEDASVSFHAVNAGQYARTGLSITDPLKQGEEFTGSYWTHLGWCGTGATRLVLNGTNVHVGSEPIKPIICPILK
jgi:hypothetical protein